MNRRKKFFAPLAGSALLLLTAPPLLCAAETDGSATLATGNTASVHAAPALSFAALLERAWQRLPEARASDADRDAAQQLQHSSRWLRDAPQLSLRQLDARSGRSGETELELSLPLRLSAQALQRADAAGALRSDADAALLRLELARELLALIATLQSGAQHLSLLQAQVTSHRQLLDDVRRRIAAGELAPAEQTGAQLALLDSEAAQLRAISAQAQARQRWEELTGAPAGSQTANGDTPITAADIAVPDAIAAPSAAALMASDLRRHPALQSADAQHEQARASLDERRAQSWNRLDVGVALRREQDALGVEHESAGVMLSLPLDFGAPRRRELAPLNRELAAAQSRADRLHRDLELRRQHTLLQLEQLPAQLALADALRAHAREQAALRQRAHQVGELATRDYLLALNTLQDAELRLLNLQLELAGVRAEAFYLQGELP